MCRALSNQIILKCLSVINMNDILSGKTRLGIKTFEACISCCVKYKLIYDKVSKINVTLIIFKNILIIYFTHATFMSLNMFIICMYHKNSLDNILKVWEFHILPETWESEISFDSLQGGGWKFGEDCVQKKWWRNSNRRKIKMSLN